MSTFYLSDSIEDLELYLSGSDIEVANQLIMDKLQIALNVLDYTPDEAVTVAVNAESTQLTADYNVDPSADWSGDARVVIDGTGLSIDSTDGDYTISNINALLTSSDAPTDWDSPLAEMDLGLQLTVVNDRAQSLELNSISVIAGDMSVSFTGPIVWNESADSVSMENARFEISVDSDPSDQTVLSSFYIEGDLTLDLGAESLTGVIERMGVTNEEGHHLYSNDLNVSLTEIFGLLYDSEPEFIDVRFVDLWSNSRDAGDINGDGWDDLLVSAGSLDTGGQWVNQEYILFGTTTGWGGEIVDLSTLGSVEGVLLDFSATEPLSSYYVDPLGDINGDGFADLQVRAWGEWESGQWSNKELILFGQSGNGQLTTDLSTLTGVGIELNISDEIDPYFRPVGDLNGDGYDDLWINQDDWGEAGYLLFGKAEGWESEINLLVLNGTGGEALDFSMNGDTYLEAFEDLNRDGVDDLLIDFYGNSSGTSQEYVLLGNSGGWGAAITMEDLTGVDTLLLSHLIFPDPDDTLYTSGDVTLPEGIEYVEVQVSSGLMVEGNSQANRMVGNSGDDTFDGGAGYDTVVYAGNYIDYVISTDPIARAITVSSTSDGTDTLTTVEMLEFADQSVSVDLLLPQNYLATGAVTIAGISEQGQMLTLTNTLSDEDGMGTMSYQWLADGVDIVGATNPSYILSEDEVGKVISVVASYTDGNGTLESVVSGATETVVTQSVVSNPVGQTMDEDTLNGLLAIRNGQELARWNFPESVGFTVEDAAGLGSGVTLSYSFLDAVPEYYSDGSEPGLDFPVDFGLFQQDHQAAVETVLSYYSSVIDVEFVEQTTNDEGQLTFGFSQQNPGTAGHAFYPNFSYSFSQTTGEISSTTESPESGDVWILPATEWEEDDFLIGGDGYNTLLHEVGHALGLKHPFEGGNQLETALNHTGYTVMAYENAPNSTMVEAQAIDTPVEGGVQTSYNASNFTVQTNTLMVGDIAALQYLYGANTTSSSEEDTYSWGANEAFFETIWDSGGTDTIDCSNQSYSCEIDLTPGSHSSIALRTTQQEVLTALGYEDYSDWLPDLVGSTIMGDLYNGRNNLAIAENVLIENLIGGAGDDTIIGNSADNRLDGGAGNDTVIYSGNYADYSFNELELGSGWSIARVTGGADGVTDEGTDTLLGIESLQFSDQTVAVDQLVASTGSTDSTDSISGTVSYWGDSAAMGSVSLTLIESGESSGQSITTQTGGTFSFSGVDLSSGAVLQAEKTVLDSSAVNLQDAILVLKQIVGLETLNSYQQIAADLDQSGSADLNDAIGILKHVVGLPTTDPEWLFMESSEPPVANAAVYITANQMEAVDLVGVLRGDVDGGWVDVA